jgi:wyosine [tRNA(Phe)-imidazoG37] synthetase (radical SAM superfamily)
MLRYCWAWDRIYIKSNSRVPCWCDSGERHTIIQKDLTKHDFVHEILNSPEMIKMRLTVLDQQKDYIKECKTCCCMLRSDRAMYFKHVTKPAKDLSTKIKNALNHISRVHDRRNWDYGSIDIVDEIQIEPCFPCNLRCPGCLHGIVAKPLDWEQPPYLLPLSSFQRMVDSILYNKITVHRISFVGRGEPTLNPKFPEMIKYVKDLSIYTTMDTNANQPFKEEYKYLTWINCSIDGSTSQSYSSYRRGGKFEKCLQFMEDGVNQGAQIRWKYILFDSTDSYDLMSKALELAQKIGIKELRFIITCVGAKDKSTAPSKKNKNEIQQFIDSQRIFQNVTVQYNS